MAVDCSFVSLLEGPLFRSPFFTVERSKASWYIPLRETYVSVDHNQIKISRSCT